MLTVDQRREYDEMFSTIQSDGWGFIVKRFQEAYLEQNQLLSIPSSKILYQAQGRLITIAQIINMESLLKAELQEIEDAAEDDGTNELEE